MIDHGTATPSEVRVALGERVADPGSLDRSDLPIGPALVVTCIVEVARELTRPGIPVAFGQPNPGMVKLTTITPLEAEAESCAFLAFVTRTYGAFRDWVVDAVGTPSFVTCGIPMRPGSVSTERTASRVRVEVSDQRDRLVSAVLQTTDYPPERLELSSIAYGLPARGGVALRVCDVDATLTSAGIDSQFSVEVDPAAAATGWADLASPWRVAAVAHECASMVLRAPVEVPFEFQPFG